MFSKLIEYIKNNKPADVKVVIGTHPLSYCDESQALLYFKEAKAKVSITQTDAITPMYVHSEHSPTLPIRHHSFRRTSGVLSPIS